MIYLHDRVTMARTLTISLDPQLHALLAKRIAGLVTVDHDLTDWTEYLVIDFGDEEYDITRLIGFSPLVEPIDGIKFGSDGFYAFWDWLTDHGDWFEMTVSFGSTFAYVLFIRNDDLMPPDLMALCRQYAASSRS